MPRRAGGVEGSGSTMVVEHTADNNLMSFRFKNQDVKMLVAEDDFDLERPQDSAPARSSFRTRTARTLEPEIRDLGLSAWAVGAGARGEDARIEDPADRLRALVVAHAG